MVESSPASAANSPDGDIVRALKTFIIEREVPGASKLTLAEMAEISRTSNQAVESLGVPYVWVRTYVAAMQVVEVCGASVVSVQVTAPSRGSLTATSVRVTLETLVTVNV